MVLVVDFAVDFGFDFCDLVVCSFGFPFAVEMVVALAVILVG